LVGATVSATAINLTWNPVFSATSYLLEVTSNSGTTWTTAASQAGTSFSATSLTADTSYEYRVSAINATGPSLTSTVVTQSTLLAAPASFTATASTTVDTEVDLAWTAVIDATAYLVERSENQALWTTLTQSPVLAGTDHAFADTTASPGTTYFYRISAIGTAGTSAPATVASALTLPDVPTLTATQSSATENDLSWTPVQSATSYLLEKSIDAGTHWTTLATQAGTQFADTGLAADTAYEYRVSAINATGAGATSTVSNITTILGSPTNLTLTAASATEVDLAYTAVAHATAYIIERSDDAGVTWVTLTQNPVLAGTDHAFADTTALAGTLYSYQVSAVNANGVSDPCTPVTVTTPLNAPTGFTATAVSSSQINLAWTADTDAGLLHFLIQGSSDGTTWTDLETVAAGSTSASDVRLTTATTYHYRLIAVNAGGNSAPTAGVMATTM
jgi:fibronectin type 3 domain-containing protein